jgi:hypothetical protein
MYVGLKKYLALSPPRKTFLDPSGTLFAFTFAPFAFTLQLSLYLFFFFFNIIHPSKYNRVELKSFQYVAQKYL